MSKRHKSSYHPPIPSLFVTFGHRGEPPWLGPFDAIIDTGADAIVVPTEVAEQLGERPFGKGRLIGAWDDAQLTVTYMADVEVERHIFPSILIAADPTTDEVVLGRSLLNKISLLVDGPGRLTAILDDATARRLRTKFNPDK